MNTQEPNRHIHVIDDSHESLDSVQAIASINGLACHRYTSTAEFEARGNVMRPGCLVLDHSLTKEDGAEFYSRYAKKQDAMPTVVMTGYAEVPTVVRYFRAGVFTFLEKPCEEKQLISELNAAIELDRTDLEQRQRLGELVKAYEKLTDRQRKVADLLCAGESMKGIARQLSVSQRTIESEKASITGALGAQNSFDLAVKLTELRCAGARPTENPLPSLAAPTSAPPTGAQTLHGSHPISGDPLDQKQVNVC